MCKLERTNKERTKPSSHPLVINLEIQKYDIMQTNRYRKYIRKIQAGRGRFIKVQYKEVVNWSENSEGDWLMSLDEPGSRKINIKFYDSHIFELKPVLQNLLNFLLS